MKQYSSEKEPEWWKQFVVAEDQIRFRKFLTSVKNQTYNSKKNSTTGIEIKVIKARSKTECFLKIEAVVTEVTNQKPRAVAVVANDITREKEQQKSKRNPKTDMFSEKRSKNANMSRNCF